MEAFAPHPRSEAGAAPFPTLASAASASTSVAAPSKSTNSKFKYLNPRPLSCLDSPTSPPSFELSVQDLTVVPPPAPCCMPLPPEASDVDRAPNLGRPVTRSRCPCVPKSVQVPIAPASAPVLVPTPPCTPKKARKTPRSPRVAKPRASRSTSRGSRRGRAHCVPSPTRFIVYPPIRRVISPCERPPIPEVGGTQAYSPGPLETLRSSQSSPSTVLPSGATGNIGSTLGDLHDIYRDRDSTSTDTNDSFAVEPFEPQNLCEDTESQEEIIDVEQISQDSFPQANLLRHSILRCLDISTPAPIVEPFVDAHWLPKRGRPVTRPRRAGVSKSVPAPSVPVPIAHAPAPVLRAPAPVPRTHAPAPVRRAHAPAPVPRAPASAPVPVPTPPHTPKTSSKAQKTPKTPRVKKPRASRSSCRGSRQGHTRETSPREKTPIPEGGTQASSSGSLEATRSSQSSPSTVLPPGATGDMGSTLGDLHDIYRDRDSFAVAPFKPQNLCEDTRSQGEIIDVEEISQENFAQVNVSQDSLDLMLSPQMLNSNIFDMPDFPDNFLETLDDETLNDADDPNPPAPGNREIDCPNHVSGAEDEPEVEEEPAPDPNMQDHAWLYHGVAPYALQLHVPNPFIINLLDDSDEDDLEEEEIEPNERNQNANEHEALNGDLNPIERHLLYPPLNIRQPNLNADLDEPPMPNVQPANRPMDNQEEDRN